MSLFCEINSIYLVSSIFLPCKPVKLKYDIPLKVCSKRHNLNLPELKKAIKLFVSGNETVNVKFASLNCFLTNFILK